MKAYLKIELNRSLYLRDPEDTDIGKKILSSGVALINEIGFENFNFKKLALEINSTEATVYRYFENKHKFLLYLMDWYWSWLKYLLQVSTQNSKTPKEKIDVLLDLITQNLKTDLSFSHIDAMALHNVVRNEGPKSFLSKSILEDTILGFHKPYSDFCLLISSIFLEIQPNYKYPVALANTVIETGYNQLYFSEFLPQLTEITNIKGSDTLKNYLKELIYKALV